MMSQPKFMLLLWPCSLFLIISYLVAVNRCKSEALKADNFAVDVVVVVVVVVILGSLLFLE